MKIAGFQKLTLLDYPDHMSCIIFTPGCNFRCPFCQNGSLVIPGRPLGEIHEEEIFSYLSQRKGLLEGVVITGGEPLLQNELEDFIRKIKAIGYPVKLDTNGSFPDQLQLLMEEQLIDYVAMDIKNSREHYARASGVENEKLIPDIERSISILKNGKIPFEFRSTLVKGIHNKQDVEQMARWIAGEQSYFLQSYVESEDIISPENLGEFSQQEREEMVIISRKYCPNTSLR